MPKLLLVSIVSLLMASGAVWAAALQVASATESGQPRLAAPGQRGAAAVDLPATPPARDPVQQAWGYQTSERLAQQLQGEQRAVSRSAAAAPAGGTAATVTVTATVLPVRTIVVDAGGRVSGIWSNAAGTRGADSLYVVRQGSPDGAPGELDAAIWAQVRELLARANHATGRVA